MASYNMSPRATWIFVVSLISFLLQIPPLLMHFRSKNHIVSTIIASTMALIACRIVNALIWPSTATENVWKGQGLCDVQVKLFIGLNMLIPGALTCLFRQLAILLDPNRFGLSPSEREKRRTMTLTVLFCGVLPVLRMILAYFVQPDRYKLVGIHGCQLTADRSWPTYALLLTWPLAVLAIGLCYGVAATWRMTRHYTEISKLLSQSTHPRHGKRKLIKTYVFAMILFVLIAPASGYIFWSNRSSYLQPYSWSRIHPKDWSERISVDTGPDNSTAIDICNAAFGFIVFGCFGLGHEALEDYRRSWYWTLERLTRLRETWRASSKVTVESDNVGPRREVNSMPVVAHFELETDSGHSSADRSY